MRIAPANTWAAYDGYMLRSTAQERPASRREGRGVPAAAIKSIQSRTATITHHDMHVAFTPTCALIAARMNEGSLWAVRTGSTGSTAQLL